MKTQFYYSFRYLAILVFFIGILSCEKEEVVPITDPVVTQVPLAYDSLYTSGKIQLHQTCTIICAANGKDISYSWELNLGTLLGSGSEVTFNACCAGNHTIKCTVLDGYGNSAFKEVSIFVPE